MFELLNRMGWATGCSKYAGRIEGYLPSDAPLSDADSGLEAHVRECDNCREALDIALLSRELMRSVPKYERQPSDAFVTRVMAAIREQEAGAIWRPLELLASRFAMVAAMVLLAISVYLAEFAPARNVAVNYNAETEIGAGMPEAPHAQPSSQDDVLISLASSEADEY